MRGMGHQAHPLLFPPETPPPLQDHVSSESRSVKIDCEINRICIKTSLGGGCLVTRRQTDALLDFALAFRCPATSRSAAAAMAVSSPNPGSQCTRGSLRNQVSWRLA